MATVYWLGVDGDLANTANYSSGALPANGDDFVINSGSIDINANLTALSAKTLKSWSVTPGFTGNIGSNGTSITINVTDASATTLRVSIGGSYIYWTGTFSGSGDITIGGTGNGTFYMTGGSFSGKNFIGGQSGRIVIGSGITMGNVQTAGAGMDISTAFTTGLFHGGTSVLRADVTTLTLGTNATCSLQGSGVDVTTANLYGGSRFILNNGGSTAGVITTVNAYPGSYLANGGSYDNTITTLNQWAGSTQVLSTPNAKTTVGTTNQVAQK